MNRHQGNDRALHADTPPSDPALELAAARRRLASLIRTTEWNTPLDIAEHRSRLRQAVAEPRRTTHSAFRYPDFDANPVVAEARHVDRLCQHVEPLWGDLVREDLAKTLEHVQAIAARDDHKLTVWSRRAAGLPDNDTTTAAGALLAASPPAPDPPATLGSRDAAAALERALAGYGLQDWRVEVRHDMASNMSVSGTRQLLKVRGDARFSAGTLARLVVHEVGGHVLRWVNALAQDQPLLAVPLGNAVPTEEGLAAYLEEEMQIADLRQLRIYAARTLAVTTSQQAGIIEVARKVAPSVGVETAVEIAIRAKRGMIDPNAPGGPTKDHGYLTGLLALRKLSARAPDVVPLLRRTKWPMEFLPILRSMESQGLLKPAAVIPDLARLGLRPLQ